MRGPTRLLVAVVLAAPATGCADAAGDPQPVTVTDSAGVEVVTNLRAPAFLPVRDLPPAPEREVVHDALYQVTALHAFDDGGVAVGASGSRAILVFDADGALVATLGRAGDGPGEFQGVGGIVPLPGDSLAVWDPRQQRLTVFPPEGGAPRLTSLADLIQGYAGSRLRPLDEGMALVLGCVPVRGGAQDVKLKVYHGGAGESRLLVVEDHRGERSTSRSSLGVAVRPGSEVCVEVENAHRFGGAARYAQRH